MPWTHQTHHKYQFKLYMDIAKGSYTLITVDSTLITFRNSIVTLISDCSSLELLPHHCRRECSASFSQVPTGMYTNQQRVFNKLFELESLSSKVYRI